jgi:hypothetical protein
VRRRFRFVALAAVLAFCPTPARAADPPRTSALGWARLPGAESCIGARDLARAVEQRLGRAVFVSPSQAELFIDGRIEPAPATSAFGPPGFRAHLTLTDAGGSVLGTRDLDAPGVACRVLDEQLALVIALLIDPEAALRPTPIPAVSPPEGVVKQVIVPVAAPAPAREPVSGAFFVGPSLVAGLTPKIGPALSFRGDVLPPGLFPFELGLIVGLNAEKDASSSTASATASAPKGATLSFVYALLGACPLTWTSGGTRLLACADVEVGAIGAVGYGFLNDTPGQEQLIVQGSLEARMTRRLVGPLELGLALALTVPFTWDQFYYLDAAGKSQQLFQTSPVASRMDAALGLTFR